MSFIFHHIHFDRVFFVLHVNRNNFLKITCHCERQKNCLSNERQKWNYSCHMKLQCIKIRQEGYNVCTIIKEKFLVSSPNNFTNDIKNFGLSIITPFFEGSLKWQREDYNTMHYTHHTCIFDHLDSLEKMKIMVQEIVQIVVDSLKKQFLNLPIFTISNFFTTKHYLDDKYN